MGDVFDRIVGRAAAPQGPAQVAAVAVRRTPVFRLPDHADTDPERLGPAAATAEVGTVAPPPPPAQVVPEDRPAARGHRDGPEPEPRLPGRPRVPSAAPDVAPPATGLGRERPDRAAPDPDPSPELDVAVGRRRPADAAPERAHAQTRPPAPPPSGQAGPPATAPARAELRVRPRPSPRRPTARPPSTRTLPAEELLRGHIAPALADLGVLGGGDDMRLTAAGLDPVEVPTGGDVHLHLGHVEVVQQAPARPAPEPPRPEGGGPDRAERVDHADYLARQQRRWS